MAISAIGLWSYETRFGSSLNGELTVVRRPDRWRDRGKRRNRIQTVRQSHPVFVSGATRSISVSAIEQGIEGFWILFLAARNTVSFQPALCNPAELVPHCWRPSSASSGRWPILSRCTCASFAVKTAFSWPLSEIPNSTRRPISIALRRTEMPCISRREPIPPLRNIALRRVNPTHTHRLRMLAANDFVRRTAPQEAANFFRAACGSPPYADREPPSAWTGGKCARGRPRTRRSGDYAHLVQSIIDGDPAARRPSLIHSMLIAYRCWSWCWTNNFRIRARPATCAPPARLSRPSFSAPQSRMASGSGPTPSIAEVMSAT